MKNAVFAGTLAALLIPLQAAAGGYVAPADPAPVGITPTAIPVGTDWSGIYGGVQLEYGDVSADTTAGVAAASGDNALYGVFVGARHDYGNFVVGAELDLNFANIDLVNPGGVSVGSLDSVHRFGGEFGYDAGPALVYGIFGAARASATIGGVDMQDNGYFFGAGVDYMLTDQIIVGAEVLQHEFDNFDSSGLDISATTFGINAAFRF